MNGYVSEHQQGKDARSQGFASRVLDVRPGPLVHCSPANETVTRACPPGRACPP
jgi:hypothetical protein